MHSIITAILVVAVVTRIVTKEAIFAGLQDWAYNKRSAFAHLLTCSFCFSVWLSVGVATTFVAQSGTASDLWAWTQYTCLFVAVANPLLIAYEMLLQMCQRARANVEYNKAQVTLSQLSIATQQIALKSLERNVVIEERVAAFNENKIAQMEKQQAAEEVAALRAMPPAGQGNN